MLCLVLVGHVQTYKIRVPRQWILVLSKVPNLSWFSIADLQPTPSKIIMLFANAGAGTQKSKPGRVQIFASVGSNCVSCHFTKLEIILIISPNFTLSFSGWTLRTSLL